MIKEQKNQELIIPQDSLVFIPLGGVTGIGLNFFLYGYKGKWLIVDCGMGFPGDNFPGIDILLPDPSFIASHKKDIVGLIITHGHEDHIGAIPFLWKDLQCPIYATPFAAELIEYKLGEAELLGKVKLEIVEMNALLELSPFKVEFIPVNHSIPEPNMLAIHTKEGTIVHTGDWKFDSAPIIGNETDTKILKRLGKEGVLALVSDSTNIFLEKDEKTETDVRLTLIDIFKQAPQRIVVTCFASNVGRLESIYWAAKEAGRKVCLMGRSLWRIDDAARAAGYMKKIPTFLTEDEASEVPEDKLVYICTGSQGEPFSALSKIASTKQSHKDQFHLNEKDIVIFSSRVIPGNELAISALQKRLMLSGCTIITDRERLVHVSGHPAKDSMEKLYSYLKPKVAIPVHGEPMSILEHKKLAEKWGAHIAMVIEEGDVLELNDGDPEILGEIPVGCLAVDGKRIISLGADVLKKRRKMIEGGTIVGTVVVNQDGYILGTPKFSSFGLMDNPTDEETLLNLIYEHVTNMDKKDKKEDDKVQETVRLTVRHFISEQYGKKPLIEIHLIRV